MKITINDCRKAHMCASGVKTFCKNHNLSLRDLCGEGLEEEALLATNDAMAKKVVEAAHGR